VSFYHPTDGYLYGWRWSNGDEAWWSTEDLALRHPRDIAGQPGQPIRRRYVVGAVEPWSVEGLPALCGDAGPGETRCTFPAGHRGPWHDNGTACWAMTAPETGD
jgi:hypothetical protein